MKLLWWVATGSSTEACTEATAARCAALQGGRQGRRVGGVAFEQLDPFVVQGQVVALAGGQVVQHTHAVAARQQRVGQVGADETGAAGDQDGAFKHACSTCPIEPANLRARRAA